MRPSKIKRDTDGNVILPKGVKLNHDEVEPSNLLVTNVHELTNDGLFKAIVEQDGGASPSSSNLDYGKLPEAGDETTAFAAKLPLRLYKVNPTEVQTLSSDTFRHRAEAAKEKKSKDDTSITSGAISDTNNGIPDSE